jgi:uncharacterized protein involved in exopolysaccharide biosynthesis/Mrp family chromosome partitioning ATPase
MFAIDAHGDGATGGNGRSGSYQPVHPAQGGRSLFWFIKAIFRTKLWMLLGALAGLGLAALFATTITSRYVSTAQILIDPRDLRVLQNEVTPSGIINDSSTAYLESQARVINSDRMKLRVIADENLTGDPEFGGEPESEGLVKDFIRDLSGPPPARRPGDATAAALDAMDKRVTVRRGERTFVIDIAVSSRDPDKAARLANAFVQAYFRDQAEVRSQATQRTSSALTGRLAELRDKLRDAEEKVQAFKAANDIASIGGRSVNEEQLTQGGTLLGTARQRTAESRARFDQLRTLRPAMLESGSLPEAVGSNTITALRAQLGGALGREADLVTQLGPSHPQMIAARSQVRDARRQIADELERIVQAARIDFERAQSAERSITQRFSDLKKDTFQVNQASVQLRELEREAEASRAVYQAFLLRAREATELVNVDSTNARIISDASPATRRSNIPRKLILLAGMLAGTGLGFLLGLARLISHERALAAATPQGPAMMAQAPSRASSPPKPAFSRITDPVAKPAPPAGPAAATLAAGLGAAGAAAAKPGWRRMFDDGESAETTRARLTPEAVAIQAGLAVLSRLPDARQRGWMRAKPQIRSVFQGKGMIVDALERPDMAFAKAVNDVLAAMPEAGEAGRNRLIIVLGLGAGSGASTLSLNMALAASRQGDVPLLVDLGRGSTTLSEALDAVDGPGFDDVLDGTVGFVRAALQDEATGIFFLPREKGRMRPATEVTATRIEKSFIPSLRRFDPVVIDGAALGSDPLLVALIGLADDVVLVGKPHEITVDAIGAAKRALGDANRRLRGLVINEG